MEWSPITCLLGVLFILLVVAIEVTRSFLVRWWHRRVRRHRAQRAHAGEIAAEALLENLGYRVLERQPRRSFCLDVDGSPHVVELRADLLVERQGRRMIAEVKTGSWAPRIENRATRRQLLEYRVAYREVDGVLLVDPEAKEVQEIGFPIDLRPTRKATFFIAGGLIGVILGTIATWLLFAGGW